VSKNSSPKQQAGVHLSQDMQDSGCWKQQTEVVAVVIVVADGGDYVHYVAQYRAARQQRHRKARTHARTRAAAMQALTSP
jgi:hypothetical protein